MRRRFEGKVALVTGGNAGIGLATARAFAREGARVMIAARRRAELEAAVATIRAEGGTADFIETDVADAGSARAMVATCVDRFGGLDVAYNNAGITGQVGTPIDEADIDQFDRVMAVNVRGVWLAMKYEIAAMRAAGHGGAIVNCSSTAGVRGGHGNASAYYASKHAVIGMTANVATEQATAGIRVNAICPGMVVTDITRTSFRGNEAKLAYLEGLIPMKRTADADEMAQAVLWLCSAESSFVTGIAMPVDGGTTI